MTLLGDLFSSEKSTGKKNIYHISADCGEFGPGGAVPADPHGCHAVAQAPCTMGVDGEWLTLVQKQK